MFTPLYKTEIMPFVSWALWAKGIFKPGTFEKKEIDYKWFFFLLILRAKRNSKVEKLLRENSLPRILSRNLIHHRKKVN
jgi:hypothetical protein